MRRAGPPIAWRPLRLAALILVVVPLLCGAYLFGALSYSRGMWPIPQIQKWKDEVRGMALDQPLLVDSTGRLLGSKLKTPVPCPPQDDRTAVLLAIGQSHASNDSGQRYRSAHGERVLNYHDGKCYVAESPLLGATGRTGESWTLLANRMIDAKLADRVILVSTAVGGSFARRWRDGGDLNATMLEVLREMQPRYRVTHTFWMQGEADLAARTSEADYTTMVRSLVGSLRRAGMSGPIYLSVSTYCDVPNWTADNPIARAQRSLPKLERGVYVGVDLDHVIAPIDRVDGCHLSGSGQEKLAAALLEALRTAH